MTGDGRTELWPTLALTYANRAISLAGHGNHRQAVPVFDQAIRIWELIVKHDGHSELEGNIHRLRLRQAFSLLESGGGRQARGQARSAYAALAAEIGRTGGGRWESDLEWGRERLGDILA